MATVELCRLCLGKENLVWIFDEKLEQNDRVKEVIHTTTGIEIHRKDIISQNVCTSCLDFAVATYKFRCKSQESDQYLKAQCKEHLKNTNITIPNTEVKVSVKTETYPQNKTSSEKHPSVCELMTVYPKIRLPETCFKDNINPVVSMPLDDVESYFKSHNLNFNEYVKFALKKKPTIKRPLKLSKKKASNVIRTTKLPTNFIAQIVSNTTDVQDESIIQPIKIKISKQNTISRNSHTQKNGRRVSCENRTKFKRILSNKETHTKSSKYQLLNREVIGSDYRSEFTETPTTAKKRRLSNEDGYSMTEAARKEEFTKYLNLTPKSNNALLTVSNGSPLSLSCSSTKELRRHKNEQLHCQFCKVVFPTAEGKTHHLGGFCLIKNAMTNLPNLELQKVENNLELRLRYPEAFLGFSLEGCIPNILCTNKNSATEKRNAQTDSKISRTDLGKTDGLMSDSEELPKGSTKSSVAESRIPKIVTAVPNDSEQFHSKKSSIQDLEQSHQVTKFSHLIIKPDVNILNSRCLDEIDPKSSEIEILKKLLLEYTNQPPVEKDSQTDFSNHPIINKNEEIILKDLKSQFHAYKVKYEYFYGDQFNVTYGSYQKPKLTQKMDVWNDLISIGIRKATPRQYVCRNNNNNFVIISQTNHKDSRVPQTVSTKVLTTSPVNINSGKAIYSYNNKKTNSLQKENSMPLADSIVPSSLLSCVPQTIPENNETLVSSIFNTNNCLHNQSSNDSNLSSYQEQKQSTSVDKITNGLTQISNSVSATSTNCVPTTAMADVDYYNAYEIDRILNEFIEKEYGQTSTFSTSEHVQFPVGAIRVRNVSELI